jgi:hypothetical protein
MNAPKYNERVFINCPFDRTYKKLFDAMVFAIFDCGFVARCALEWGDGSEIRMQKIFGLMLECQLGIHDLSRIEIDKRTRLPRFNMPLELGAFLGAKRFGGKEQKRKACLILDAKKARYQKFVSNISGQDIQAHQNDPQILVGIVRDWLRRYSQFSIPSGSVIWSRYQDFKSDLPALCEELELKPRELIFNDYVLLVSEWLKLNA